MAKVFTHCWHIVSTDEACAVMRVEFSVEDGSTIFGPVYFDQPLDLVPADSGLDHEWIVDYYRRQISFSIILLHEVADDIIKNPSNYPRLGIST